MWQIDSTRLQGRGKKGRDERGFTLIELIVVCTLIGIMLSISIPSLRSSIFTDPLKTTARKVIGLVTGVREMAVRNRQPYLLHISQAENRIWFEKDVEEGQKESEESQDGELLFPPEIRISEVWVSGEEGLTEDQTVIWITRQGYLNHTIIKIEDDSGNNLKVQFHPFLDSAEVSDKIAAF